MDGESTLRKHAHAITAEKRNRGNEGKGKRRKIKLASGLGHIPHEVIQGGKASGAGSIQNRIKQWPLLDHQRSWLFVKRALTGYWVPVSLGLEPCRSKLWQNQQEEKLIHIWKYLKFHMKNDCECLIVPHQGIMYGGWVNSGHPSLERAAHLPVSSSLSC